MTSPGFVDESLPAFVDHDAGGAATTPHGKGRPVLPSFEGLDGCIERVHVSRRPRFERHTMTVAGVERVPLATHDPALGPM